MENSLTDNEVIAQKRSTFPLVGLSRPKSCTLTCGKNDDFFWPKVNLSQEKFDELWKFCKENWDEPKWGLVDYDYLDEDGMPINPVLIGITLES